MASQLTGTPSSLDAVNDITFSRRGLGKRLLLRALLLCCMTMLLSGCFLRTLFGRVDPRDQPGGLFVTFFHGDFSIADCRRYEDGGIFYECTYWIEDDDGFYFDVTSTAELLSEFGIFGVLIDPIVLQVPADTSKVVATYDDGAGPQPAVIHRVSSFEVEPGASVVPEAGQTFVILEFPDHVTATIPDGNSTTGKQFSLALRLERPNPSGAPVGPVALKAMFTGKVVVRGHTYYIPLLPCVRDFASVPAITIPVSTSDVDLMSDVRALALGHQVSGCSFARYNFTNVPPPPEQQVYLPLLLRGD